MSSQVAGGHDEITQLCCVTDNAESVLSHNPSNRWTAQEDSTSFDDLPSELVVRILSMLPVKTLIQSTIVCKQWNTTIRDPNFISSHLSRSISDPSRHAVIIAPLKLCRLPNDREFAVFRDNNGALTHHDNLSIPFETQSGYIEIVGSCNGVLCLTDMEGYQHFGFDIFLLNPSINMFIILGGEFSSYGNLFDKRQESVSFTTIIKFGYCESEDDYRVVRIIRHDDPTLSHLVEVFSLKTGKWKSVEASINEPKGHFRPICLNSCLYWLSSRYPDKPTNLLQSFDLKHEIFRQVELPADLDPLAVHNVIGIKGSVGLATMVPVDGTRPLLRTILWALERNKSGQVKWRALKSHDVEWKDFNYQVFRLLGVSPFLARGFGANGKLIVEEVNRKHTYLSSVFAVDFSNSNAVERLAVDLMSTVDPCYVESLVLLNR